MAEESTHDSRVEQPAQSTTGSFGELVLVIGDFHCPSQKPALPEAFRELLSTDKICHVLCTGNLGSRSILNLLNAVAPNNVHIVRGDMDVALPGYPEAGTFPEYKTVIVGNFRIGLIHGHQVTPWEDYAEALTVWQRRLNCDILVSGFTHQHTAEKVAGKLYVNPGSATGAARLFLSRTDGPDTNAALRTQLQDLYNSHGTPAPAACSATTVSVLPSSFAHNIHPLMPHPVLLPTGVPSFMLMSVKSPNCVILYVYELSPEGKVHVAMSEFTKEEDVADSVPPVCGSDIITGEDYTLQQQGVEAAGFPN